MAFPGVLANDDVTLDIRKGEVFALVGENGAGSPANILVFFRMMPEQMIAAIPTK